ncbi:hypothetical protein SAMN05661010_01703 [Modicisalibacter muralis]|uniref:Uncharacterized protein n=1 Tax=Modicisalibacter muralis TaxID=119000 RepID=A0A1G9K2F8_9GAMM|nr:hypothetical protein [Halomonas muralis]SDL43393.1 hypothetical protein SAMN05661010_01703 [Halomonas muralis]
MCIQYINHTAIEKLNHDIDLRPAHYRPHRICDDPDVRLFAAYIGERCVGVCLSQPRVATNCWN